MVHPIAANTLVDRLARRLAPALVSLAGEHDSARALRATPAVINARSARLAADAVDTAQQTIPNDPWNTDAWMALGFVSRALREPPRAAEFAQYALERARFAAADALAVGVERGWHSKAQNAKNVLRVVESLHQHLTE